MLEHHDPYLDLNDDAGAADHGAGAANEVPADGVTDAAHADFIASLPADPTVDTGLDDLTDRSDADASGALVVTDPSGTPLTVGEPTLSSTGGAPDSAVVHTEAGAEVYTDTDGDGSVDQIARVAPDGQVAVWHLDAAGAWELTTTGTIGVDGAVDLRPLPVPHDDDVEDPDAPAPGSTGQPQITVPGADGTEFTGKATADADGDGVPDTVWLRSADGTVTGGSDFDGDGVAEQITVIAPDGQVTVRAVDDDGTWQVVATGRQQPDGSISLDSSTDTDTDTDTGDGTPAAADTANDGTDGPETGDHGEPPAPDDPAGPTEPGEFAGQQVVDRAEVPDGHLAAQVPGGFIDVGRPQYDMDGDGAPETTIVEHDGAVYQYSDTDGDGTADQLLRVSAEDRSASIAVNSGDGWETVTAGHIAADGDFVPDDAPPEGHLSQASDENTHQATDRPGAPDIAVALPDGTSVPVGAPDQDLDGDGVAESVAVRTEDDTILIVSDTDADGSADQVIEIDQHSGDVRWLAVDADGHWNEVQHGHIAADGALVVDEEPSAMTGPDQVTVAVDGRTFPAGPATVDTDGDGVADTVAVPGVGGSTQYYQDADGDGIADRAWTVHADGTTGTTYTIDDDGTWVPTDSSGPRATAGAGVPQDLTGRTGR